LQDLMFRQFNLPHPFYAVALRGCPVVQSRDPLRDRTTIDR
jgi:hypothetical protein